MKNFAQRTSYDALIREIRRKRKILAVFMVTALLVTLILASPTYIGPPENPLINYGGMNPVIAVLIVFALLIIGFILAVVISMPLTASLDEECDPQKYLALNTALGNRNTLCHVYAKGCFYAGDFSGALRYATEMIASEKEDQQKVGLFYKARCEFLLGDFDSLRRTAGLYENALLHAKREKKNKNLYENLQTILLLLCALADGDLQKIEMYRKQATAWNRSKATEGYLHYIKGVAAHRVGDEKESIYHFMAVKENCGKTVFSKLADEFLAG